MSRISVVHLAPWVDYGGTDKGTIDWFRWLDRDRFEPSLVTTQPSPNRRLAEVVPYAHEFWPLPDVMAGAAMPAFIFDLLHSREVDVLHVMNSRLGFDLLPDLGCLARPPKVVVQLHVEEADRSGYVRYVTTRYGNLVDAFSVTSHHLADAVHEYGVPRGKIRVIHTGVDAEREFAPDRVAPIEGLEPGLVHVLYPGRLVDQKDPLLMTEVARRVADLPVRIHVVGDGPLEDEVRRSAPDIVRFHPPTPALARWFRACDLLLMTSVFEGVPYVAYEAMAMGVPVVAPALPGNVEVIGPDGVLVEPRNDVDAYVAALRRLVENEPERRALGERARERMRREFTLQQMAEEHERLYEELALQGARPPGTAPADGVRPEVEPLRFPARPLHGTPLVSVVIPCFNHGRFLPACVESVQAQTYPELEIVVVDDGSTDTETLEVLDRLEGQERVNVMRLPENHGPSVARNLALESANGRYVLPVDADNVLVADAVERLVAQLAGAGETVGFVYPSIQYFGNRDDWFAAPAYNRYALLRGNYADTCSLFDRDVFEAGVRFEEEIKLGHEDWDLMLQLAERDVRGEPARGRTVLYRKWGFNRSDAVEYSADLPSAAIRARSPLVAREMEVKAAWAPAVSVIALAEIDPATEPGERLAERLAFQSTIDAELVARFEGDWPVSDPAPAVRRLPPALAADPAEAAREGRAAARGRVLVMTRGTASELLADRGFVEKVLRRLGDEGAPDTAPDAIAFVAADGYPFAPLPGGAPAEPHAIAWRVEAEELLPPALPLDRQDPVSSLARLLNGCGARIAWHVAPAPRTSAPRSSGELLAAPRLDPPGDEHLAAEREMRLTAEPQIPAMPFGSVRRWSLTPTWTRPQTLPLCRHREAHGEGRAFSVSHTPPPGYVLEWDLGRVNAFALAGTARLLPDLTVAPHESAPAGEHLGFVELAPLPLLDALLVGVHRDTGQRVLVASEDDPLLGAVDVEGALGWVDPYPVRPRRRLPDARAFGTAGLLRSVDLDERRHRYAVGAFPPGAPAGELGALATDAWPGTRPVWIAGGWLVTEEAATAERVDPRAAARWALAPVRWRGFSEPLPKARAIARRTAVAARAAGAGAPVTPPAAPPAGTPASGHLWTEPGRGRRPLWSALHPVTGDRLLTPHLDEALDMGYTDPEILGWMLDQHPATGSSELASPPIPWASRFGVTARRR